MDVIHNPDQQRFCVQFNSELAELNYQMVDEQTVNFTRTFVPESLRRQGIAERLVRAGLSWAKSANYHIVADCWYVERFLR